jgi:hypothetical protein
MSFRHGRWAEIVINTTSDLSDFCDKADINVDVDVTDVAVFQAAWKARLEGQAAGGFELGGSYDEGATGPAAVLFALIGGGAVPLVLYPGGNTAGQRSWTASVIMSSYKESTPVGGQITFSASFQADGEITPGTVGA